MVSIREWNIAAGLIIWLLAGFSFFLFFKTTGDYLNVRGLFVLCWFFAIGLSAFKIHPLQTQWSIITWLCLWLAAIAFIFGCEVGGRVKVKTHSIKFIRLSPFLAVVILSAVIIGVFIIEIVEAGGLPIFSANMYAYKKFGITFLHYVTVTCAIVPALCISLFYKRIRLRGIRLWVIIVISLIMLSIPVLIVSRQLLLMECVLAAIVFLEKKGTKKIPLALIIVLVAAAAAGWIIISMFRNQSDAYLIKQLKLDDKMSPSLYQTYMYFAFNFDSFNHNIARLTSHTYVLESLTPLWALTRTQGILESFIEQPQITPLIKVFTTTPFIYGPYKDLGIAGVAIYSFVWGFVAGIIEKRRRLFGRYVSHAVMCYCVMFAFFEAFMSITSIWVYLIGIFLLNMIIADKVSLEAKENNG